MKLSVAMIVKNEENNLDRTLKALMDLNKKLDLEIIIVDTGSTDKTMDIARKYTDKLYEHKWSGNFSEMRNISLSYCSGDWVLVLDADEVLEDPDKLIGFLYSDKGELFNSATIRIRNYDKDDDKYTNEASLIRLFRNSKDLKYTGKVHEQPVYKKPLANSEVSFKHYGYSADDYELMNYKFERNKELLEDELKTAKGDYKIYVLFQLSKTYSMANKNDTALKYIKKAYDLEKKRKDKDTIHSFVYHWYASVLFNRKEYEKTIKICKEFEEYCDDNLDLFYMMAISYSCREDFKAAYKYYDKYFCLREKRLDGELNRDLSLTEGSLKSYDKMISNIIICYYKEKKYDKAISEFEKNSKEVKFGNDIEALYVFCCMVTKRLSKVIDFYKDKKIRDEDVESVIMNFNNIDTYEYVQDIKEVEKVLSEIDERVKIYFDCVKNSCYKDADKIDYSIMYEWKCSILERAIVNDSKNIELIKDNKNEVIKAYIEKVCNNFECLEVVYNYTKEKFLSTEIKDLNFVCNIENVLMFNGSISKDKFEDLVFRVLANKSLYRSFVYNIEQIGESNLRLVLDSYDRVCYDIEKEIKSYSKDRLSYVKKLRSIMEDSKAYTKVIKTFISKVTDNPISEEMIREKENIFNIIENMISNNNINAAEDLLINLEEVFKFDGKIYNYKGVIYFIKQDYTNALENLSLAAILMEDKFDSLFNIACVMENMKRINDAKKFYELSYKCCGDDSMKEQINEILQSLN